MAMTWSIKRAAIFAIQRAVIVVETTVEISGLVLKAVIARKALFFMEKMIVCQRAAVGVRLKPLDR